MKTLLMYPMSVLMLTSAQAQDLAPLEDRLPLSTEAARAESIYGLPSRSEQSVQMEALENLMGVGSPAAAPGVDWENLFIDLQQNPVIAPMPGDLPEWLVQSEPDETAEMFANSEALDLFSAPVAADRLLQQFADLPQDDPAWRENFDALNNANLLGNISATAIVGESLLIGRGTAIDQEAGISLLTKAMAAGVPGAFTVSGEFFLREGAADPQAELLGLQLLERGFSLGDGNAALPLAEYNMAAGRPDLARQQYFTGFQSGDVATQEQSRLGLQRFCDDPNYDCTPQQIAVAVSRVPVMRDDTLVGFSDRWPERFAPLFTAAQVVFPFRKDDAPPPWKLLFFEEPTPTDDHDINVEYAPLIKQDPFLGTLERALEQSPSERVLLYVHGFNNSVSDALVGAARLKREGRLPGVPMIYSWAAGKNQMRWQPQSMVPYVGYSHDVQIAASSCEQFRSFLISLTGHIPAERIILFGHSHGAKLIHSALTDCEFLRPPAPSFSGRFGDVIYVAPDIDRDQFLQSYAQLRDVAERVTFYASDKDSALYFSGNIVRGGLPRLGVGGDDMLVVDGVSAVDASDIPGIGDDQWGHAYAFLNETVLADIRAVLNDQEAPCRVRRPGELDSWALIEGC